MNRKLALLLPIVLALLLLVVVLILPAAAQGDRPVPSEGPEADHLPSQSLAHVEAVYFFWDFEADDGGFVANPLGEWEWGTPTYPPELTPYSGVNVWGTDLDDYADDRNWYHELTRTITLPTSSEPIILGWWDWFGQETSQARQIWISGTLAWHDHSDSSQRYWAQHAVDISAWAGQTVDIVFELSTGWTETGSDGWYIDDVLIGSGWPIYDDSTKSATVAIPDQVMTYTVVVANTGFATGTHTYLNDPIPTGTVYVPGSAQVEGGGTLTATASAIEWLGSVPAHGSVTVTFGVTVTAGSGTIINTAWITDPGALAPATPSVASLLPLPGLFEDFENGGEIPYGWTNDEEDGWLDWQFRRSARYGAREDHTTGNGYFAWLSDHNYSHRTANLLSPYLDLTALSDPQLSFWVWNQRIDQFPPPISELHIDVFDGSLWTNDVAVIDTSLTSWTEFTVDLTPYVSPASRIRFRGVESTYDESEISLDDVLISDPVPRFLGSWKRVTPQAIAPGELLTYTIYITNSGRLTSTAGRMLDTLPTGLEVVDGMLDGPGVLDVGADYVEWTTTLAAPLPPGEDLTITLVASATSDLACGTTFTNSAVITDAQAVVDTPIQSLPISVYPLVHFTTDFEDDDGGFVANPGGEWEWGDLPPLYDDLYFTRSGSRLWATTLAGTIPPEPGDHLLTYTVTLPDVPYKLYLEWWDWLDHSGFDEAYVYINDITNTLYFIDSDQRYWQHHAVDLSAWAGQTVNVVFYYRAAGSQIEGPLGWYVDDVTLHAGCPAVSFGPDQSTFACKSEEVTYYLTVDNANTTPDVFDVTSNATWPTVITPTVIPLEPGEEGTVTVTVFVPQLAPLGIGDTVTVTVTGQNSGLVDRAVLRTTYSGVRGTWETMAPLPEGRVFAAVAATEDSVYVFGGSDDSHGNTPVNTTFRYDIAANMWMTMTPMPVAIQYIDAGVVGDRIYIPGGCLYEEVTNTTYVYHVISDTWSTIEANITPSLRCNYAVAVSGTTLYRLGGSTTNRVWALDTESETWSELPPMQRERAYFTAGAIQGRLYAAGGVRTYYDPDMTTEVYTGTWSTVAPVPDGGGAYTYWAYNADAVANDLLFLMGGQRDASWTVLDHTAFYDPATDSWVTTPALPTITPPRAYLGGAAGGGYLFATGGRDYTTNFLYDTHERLQLCSGHTECTPVTEVSFTHQPAVVQEGDLITFTAIYTPATASMPVNVSWDFGDGDTASGLEVTHVFTAPGMYRVTVTAENCDGAISKSFQRTFRLGNEWLYLPVVLRNN